MGLIPKPAPSLERIKIMNAGNEERYWRELKHQYAGMAMQGILSNEKMQQDLYKAFGKDESMDITISEFAIDIANTIVKKLKEESKL